MRMSNFTATLGYHIGLSVASESKNNIVSEELESRIQLQEELVNDLQKKQQKLKVCHNYSTTLNSADSRFTLMWM